MNSGPLPPQGGLPAPLHDVADSRINYGNTLLGNLDPYAYGEPGYLSSQQGYQNHPHRMQKFIPPIHLPTARVGTTDTFCVSHPVDDSDVAFCVKLDRRSIFASGGNPNAHHRTNKSMVGTSVDPFINLPTLNYILAGLQICLTPQGAPSKWNELLLALDSERFRNNSENLHFSEILHIVQNRVFPYGIVRGSEKQGGQNETGYSPATWPVGFIAAMVIDGKDRNINNYWHHMQVDAGDDLVFRLAPVQIKNCHNYTLNHYYKSIQRQNFLGDLVSQPHTGLTPDDYIWQLVPDKFTLDLDTSYGEGYNNIDALTFAGNKGGMWNHQATHRIREYVWQHTGYWHIARSQVMVGNYGENDYYFNDLSHSMFVNHLEVTFSPTWCAVKTASTKGSATAGTFGQGETHRGVTLAAKCGVTFAPSSALSLGAPAKETTSLLGRGSALLDAALQKLDARKRARDSNSAESEQEDTRKSLGVAAAAILSESQAMDSESTPSRPASKPPSQQQRPVKKSTGAPVLSPE